MTHVSLLIAGLIATAVGFRTGVRTERLDASTSAGVWLVLDARRRKGRAYLLGATLLFLGSLYATPGAWTSFMVAALAACVMGQAWELAKTVRLIGDLDAVAKSVAFPRYREVIA